MGGDGEGTTGPMLPIYGLLPGLIILYVILFYAFRICKHPSSRFVVLAIWSRFILSTLHAYTFPKIAAGVSINALASLAIIGLGLLMIRKSLLLSTVTLPVIPLFITIFLSASINHNLPASIDIVIKFGYFVIIALHAFEVIRLGHWDAFSRASILAFSPLPVFQVISLVIRFGKRADADGSLAFIGGYAHEAAFSIGLFGLLIAVIFATNLSFVKRALWFFVSAAGIFLSTYRTTLLASLPLMLYFFLSSFIVTLPRHLRAMTAITAGVVMIGAGALLITSSSRFEGLQGATEVLSEGLKPAQFTMEDQDLLTGRVYLWSLYINAWKNSSPVRHMVGFGPDAWETMFPLYAHNTFVHFLFEYGILGEIAMVGFFLCMLLMAIFGRPEERLRLLSVQAAFFILNLATMPFWQIEGLMPLGLIWGWTVASFSLRFAGDLRAKPTVELRGPHPLGQVPTRAMG